MALRIETGKGEFTALGGLHMFQEATKTLGLYARLKEFMPLLARKDPKVGYRKFKAMMLGFVAGADCLDDQDKLNEDLGFIGACDNYAYAATTCGAFLRSFQPWQIRKINEVLCDVAIKMRRSLFRNDHDFILDIDSSAHQQYGHKMEGVEYNYANVRCLDSLQAFDQYGFQYKIDVRPGSTFTSNGVSTSIREIFAKVPRDMHRYFRGDSGMCNFDIFNACEEKRVNFVIAMRANMYEALEHRVKSWVPTKKIKFRDGRPCEVGQTVYFPKGLGKALRVVIIRAKKPVWSVFEGRYDYRAWVTNIGEHDMKNEKIVEFYRGRGNAENFIRELKNGFDIHHFPCQKLNANKVYGLISAFAYNLMRMMSWLLNKEKPHFSKMIRFRMVYLAGQVVRKARYTIIRLSYSRRKEVERWSHMISTTFNKLASSQRAQIPT